MDGLLVVDKPLGPTSHDVVVRVRRAVREKRIGHTGTLDPMATGVLCLVLGRATRLAQFIAAGDKAYDAVIRFGFATDTRDAAGRVVDGSNSDRRPTREEIDAALEAFRGTFLQQPPVFSAKKIGGTRSHELARKRCQTVSDTVGGCLTPAPVSVTARSIAIVDSDVDTVTLKVVCSAGFYVRSLAHDLGERLGVGAHLAALRRTRSGDFTLDQAVPLDVIEQDPERAASALVPLSEVLPGLPAFTLSAEGIKRAANGRELGPRDGASAQAPPPSAQPLYRLVDEAGRLVGIGRRAGAFLHPAVVLM
jgi:tRNA pseudouridine55 synthase